MLTGRSHFFYTFHRFKLVFQPARNIAFHLVGRKTTVLGFDLVADMHEIEGLPTFFFATKESKTEVEALAKSIQDELGCEEFISCSSLKAKKDAEILEDKRLARTLTRGLSDLTFPQKKGRRG